MGDRSKRGSASSRVASRWDDDAGMDWETVAEMEYTEPAGAPDQADDIDDEEDGLEAPTPQDAEEELVSYLLDNHRRGLMSAKCICTVGFWAGKAGLNIVGALGVRPDSSTGNFKRHIDVIMRKRGGDDMPGVYVVPMPAFIRSSGERGVHNLLCVPPHEALVEEMHGCDIDSEIDAWEKPPNYWTHPVVKAMEQRGKKALPVALFLDGVQYGVNNTMLVVSMTNLLTQKKHLICALRKRILCGAKCACSCKGWCSFFALWTFLHWSFKALSEAIFPERRHATELGEDGLTPSGWRPEDGKRSEVAGCAMPFAAACLQLRVDWAEMTNRIGVANHSSNKCPCFLCSCSKTTMLEKDRLGQRVPPPWTLRDANGYEQACKQCEIDLDISRLTDKQWANLKASLFMDSKKKAMVWPCSMTSHISNCEKVTVLNRHLF